MVLAPRAIYPQQCAMPLLNVTPGNGVQYTMRTITPPANRVAAMVFVTTPPSCEDAARGSNTFEIDDPAKKQ